MTEIFGVPTQALFGQLLIGLINGAFYAMLSLGLAVIFGLLNIINFTHGAQYMLGAFCAWFLLERWGIGYWWSLLLAPLAVAATGVIIERTMLSRLYKLDHLYGLVVDVRHRAHDPGRFHALLRKRRTAVSPAGGVQRRVRSGLHVPAQIPRVGDRRLGDHLLWHLVRHRAHQARVIPASGNGESGARSGFRHQRSADGHADLRLRRRAGGLRRRDGGADLPGQSADGREPDHRRLRGGRDRRHGLDPRAPF